MMYWKPYWAKMQSNSDMIGKHYYELISIDFDCVFLEMYQNSKTENWM
ncbi:hypothetical protein T03_6922 [Trichinella britovi]|uniref:Uncharacterized protein n=1 Tax=Trichinella britovi TaxID=45882 RepID=A0A0V1CD94_TRIBR|nr:hypothetical protein T03_6922 [Trichinella britovi]